MMMTAKNEKVAAQAVKLARRKAAAGEAVGLLKAAKKLRVGSLKGGKSQPTTSAKPGEGGRFKAIVGKLEHQKGVRDPEALAGAINRAKYGSKGASALTSLVKRAFGLTADQPSTQIKPKTTQPSVPAPARMKSAPKPAELALAETLIKAADTTRDARRQAYETSIAYYKQAAESGNPAHIKAASVRLANIVLFDHMTKQALSGELGAAIMKLLGKIAPTVGKGAVGVGAPGTAQKIVSWGERMGQRGANAKSLLGNPDIMKAVGQGDPELLKDLILAKQIGTGTLAAGGALGAGELLD